MCDANIDWAGFMAEIPVYGVNDAAITLHGPPGWAGR